MKRCKRCGIVKSLEDFYREAKCRDGFRPECKACNLAARKAWYQKNRAREIARVKAWQQANPERHNEKQRIYREARKPKARADHLMRAFKLTVEEYDLWLELQGGGCMICGRKPTKISLHVDHNHDTGAVRGLLCMRCNNGIGLLQESPEFLRMAADYLEGSLHPLLLRG